MNFLAGGVPPSRASHSSKLQRLRPAMNMVLIGIANLIISRPKDACPQDTMPGIFNARIMRTISK
jgi:hypothetical protein